MIVLSELTKLGLDSFLFSHSDSSHNNHQNLDDIYMLVQTQYLPLASRWKYNLLLARPSASFFQVFNVNFKIVVILGVQNSLHVWILFGTSKLFFLLLVPDHFVVRCSTARHWLMILLWLQVSKSYNSGRLAKSPYCMRLISLWLLEDILSYSPVGI